MQINRIINKTSLHRTFVDIICAQQSAISWFLVQSIPSMPSICLILIQRKNDRTNVRMAHSTRTLIVPITAGRRSSVSYLFKLIELSYELTFAQFSYYSHCINTAITAV